MRQQAGDAAAAAPAVAAPAVAPPPARGGAGAGRGWIGPESHRPGAAHRVRCGQTEGYERYAEPGREAADEEEAARQNGMQRSQQRSQQRSLDPTPRSTDSVSGVPSTASQPAPSAVEAFAQDFQSSQRSAASLQHPPSQHPPSQQRQEPPPQHAPVEAAAAPPALPLQPRPAASLNFGGGGFGGGGLGGGGVRPAVAGGYLPPPAPMLPPEGMRSLKRPREMGPPLGAPSFRAAAPMSVAAAAPQAWRADVPADESPLMPPSRAAPSFLPARTSQPVLSSMGGSISPVASTASQMPSSNGTADDLELEDD